MATQDRLPTGDSATNDNWTALGGGSKFSEVDDPVGTPDEDTSYINKSGAGAAPQDFTFTAFDISSSAIASITVTLRTRVAAGVVSTIVRIKVNGTAYTTGSIATSGSYTNKTNTWLTNPNTGVDWTEADVEGTGANPLQEFGVSSGSQGAGEEIRCTQAYITVDYTPASSFIPYPFSRGARGGMHSLSGGMQ